MNSRGRAMVSTSGPWHGTNHCDHGVNGAGKKKTTKWTKTKRKGFASRGSKVSEMLHSFAETFPLQQFRCSRGSKSCAYRSKTDVSSSISSSRFVLHPGRSRPGSRDGKQVLDSRFAGRISRGNQKIEFVFHMHDRQKQARGFSPKHRAGFMTGAIN